MDKVEVFVHVFGIIITICVIIYHLITFKKEDES